MPEPTTFEWDKGNSDKNFKKHDVTNREAEEVFDNEPKFIFEDQQHSSFEKRYMIWSVTGNGRKLSVFFTIRNDRVRIISARDMQKKERREYEERIKTDTEV